MAAFPRKVFIRNLKQWKWRRDFCVSASARNDKYVVKSALPDVVIPEVRFLDRLWRYSASFQDRVALECAKTKKRYTYSELQRNMAVFATSLHQKMALRSDDVVAVMVPNSPEFPVLAFGTIQAGCVLTTVNPIYKEFEICHQVSTTEPKVIVTIPECYEVVTKALRLAKSSARVVLVDTPGSHVPEGVIRYSEIAENGEADYKMLDTIEKKPDDIAFIPFSSGTTGMPKGVEISYKNLLAAIEMMQREENSFPILAHGDFQDVLPCILPFFHIYGLVVTLIGHLAKGAKLVTIDKFSAGLYFDVLREEKVTLLYIVPPIAILLGKHPDVRGEYFRRVRHIVCGAAPLAATDANAVLERSCNKDIEFNQGYGATETTSLVTSTFKGTKNLDYDACGVPMAGVRLKFVDPLSGETVPVGQSGEMYVHGPMVMRGYHRNPRATAESITADGYFRTGDLGHFVPGKGLFITDRIKELIKVKGMQVAPAELESLLRSHPAVADAAVIGVPHEFYGECPKAFVIPKSGQKIAEEELRQFVAHKVADFKRIQEVIFVQNIPKTSSGKILRKELKKMFA